MEEKRENPTNHIVELLQGFNGMEQNEILREVNKVISEQWALKVESIQSELKEVNEQFDNFQHGDSPRQEERLKKTSTL